MCRSSTSLTRSPARRPRHRAMSLVGRLWRPRSAVGAVAATSVAPEHSSRLHGRHPRPLGGGVLEQAGVPEQPIAAAAPRPHTTRMPAIDLTGERARRRGGAAAPDDRRGQIPAIHPGSRRSDRRWRSSTRGRISRARSSGRYPRGRWSGAGERRDVRNIRATTRQLHQSQPSHHGRAPGRRLWEKMAHSWQFVKICNN